MNYSNVSLDNFCKWLIKERKNFENKLKDDCINSQELLKKFLNDWPLDNLKNISLDEYIKLSNDINTGGEYSNLYMSIGGGYPAIKFLLSKNDKENVFLKKIGRGSKKISEQEATIYFEKLREDLVDILENGLNFKFDKITSTNEFYNCSAMIIKLLSIYSNSSEGKTREPSYFSVNNNSQTYKNYFKQLLPNRSDEINEVYRQNHEITKYINERVPDLDQVILSYSIHRYVEAMKNKEDTKEERENNMLYSDILKKSKNLILRGAPGTGKTYLAKEIAKELTDGNEDQIGFVQFHPSYDYTDFVEGLRPDSNEDGSIFFKLKEGIFKNFCQNAIDSKKIGGQDNFDEAWDLYLEYVNNRDEKEYLTEFSYLTVNSRNNFNINYETKSQGTVLTKSYVYELYKDENYLKQPYYHNQGKKVLETLKKRFGLKDYISPEEVETDKKFVFIIDEINRGEISKIFGELFFSIDPGYRGEKGCVSTQYANLHETNEKFYIPENVYIIGTMNDIDRSVDTFDFAMRRRFRFVEVTAESQLGMLDKELNIYAEEAKTRLRNLNAAIENVQELNSHYHIGPSYFLKLKDVDFDYELLWSDYLKPLLEDYLRGSYEEAEILETLKKAFDLTNNEQKDQAVADDNEGDENDAADY